MKNVFLFKTHAESISFDCHGQAGLTFVTSVQDVSALNNVLITDLSLKIIVQQDISEQAIGKPVLWFLLMNDDPMNNESLEKAWKLVTKVGSMLYRYTELGLRFSYEHVWSYPQIRQSWTIEKLGVHLNENGTLNGIYCDDETQPTYEENGEILRQGEIKQVKADIVTVIGSENMRTQAHFAHITLPGHHQIDTADFYLKRDLIERVEKYGLTLPTESHSYLLELFNRAITAKDVFSSALILYQMIEVIIKTQKPRKIPSDVKKELKKYLKSTDDLAPFTDRIMNAVGMVNHETSKELLTLGLSQLIGEDAKSKLDLSNLSRWRNMRGSLTHPSEAQAMTEMEFIELYQELRKFCKGVVDSFFPEKESKKVIKTEK